MSYTGVERRLSVILAADVVGFSSLMEADEESTVRALSICRISIDDSILRHQGRVFGSAGDSLIAEFSSPIEAVRCAVNIQEILSSDAVTIPGKSLLQYRIGINLGDVIVDGNNLLGDGVNIAARLESIANPGGIALSQSVHEQVKKHIELEFDDWGEQSLKNISDPVRVFAVSIGNDCERSTLGKKSGPAPGFASNPSIAVLPFTNLSGDSDQEYFADGMVEDIITDLSRFKELLVIARNSSFSYKGRQIGIKDIASDLGVRYVVEGSIRKSNDQLRVTAQLIDSADQSHIWGERYNRKLEEIFSVQDEIVESIVGKLVSHMERNELKKVMRKSPSDLQAYDFILKARAIVCDSAETNLQCRELYLSALQADPQNADACCGISMTHGLDFSSGWTESGEHSQEHALEYALKAVALDDDNSEAHTRLGNRRIYSKEYDLALYHLEKALSLNPNNCAAWAYKGMYYIWTGESETALLSLKEATRRNPFNVTWYFWFLGLAYYCLKRYQEAVFPLTQSISNNPKFIAPRRHLAACYAQLGEIEKAEEQRLAIMEIDPGFSISSLAKTLVYRDSSDLKHYLDGLRKAGLPE